MGHGLIPLGYTPIVRSQIEKSMEEAIALYNRLGSFNKHFYVRYVASVPTANASIAGQITFGNLRSTSTAIHEISHALGSGTSGRWAANRDGNTWIGDYGAKLVKEFDGEAAVLSADRFHFWPYGLNFSREDTPINRIRHVRA